MEIKTISYAPTDMASFNFIIEAAITNNLNIKTNMATHTIAVEIPEGNDFNERMEISLKNESVEYTSTVVASAVDNRDNIIAEISGKLSEAQKTRDYFIEEEKRMHMLYLDEMDRNNRVKEQIGALRVMMDAIFNTAQ